MALYTSGIHFNENNTTYCISGTLVIAHSGPVSAPVANIQMLADRWKVYSADGTYWGSYIPREHVVHTTKGSYKVYGGYIFRNTDKKMKSPLRTYACSEAEAAVGFIAFLMRNYTDKGPDTGSSGCSCCLLNLTKEDFVPIIIMAVTFFFVLGTTIDFFEQINRADLPYVGPIVLCAVIGTIIGLLSKNGGVCAFLSWLFATVSSFLTDGAPMYSDKTLERIACNIGVSIVVSLVVTFSGALIADLFIRIFRRNRSAEPDFMPVAPGMVGPGMVGPGMVGPGMAGPGMVGPGMVAPGMVAPGMFGFSGAPQVYEPPKKSKAWIVILVIVLVLVLAAGALFAFGRIGFSGCSQNGFMNYHEQEDSFYAENDVPPSYAASVQDGEAFSYIVEEGTATLTDYHFKTEITDNATGEYGRYLAGSVVVPETIDGYTVAALGDYLFYGCRFESITLPDTLTYIGPGAFSYAMFENGTVEIPDSVTAIAEEAFYRSNYSHIQLPEGLGYIGDFAFAETDLSGETVFIPSKVETLFEYSFFNSGISGFAVDFENPYFYMKKEHLCGDGIMIDSSGSPIALG